MNEKAFPPSNLAARRRMDIGLALMAEGDIAAAHACFQAAAEADPDWAEAWFALAEASEKLGDREAAVAGYRGYLARAEDDVMGALPRLALLGATVLPDRLPPAYVRRLFDDYAPRFDTSLAALDYQGPQLLRALWDTLSETRPRPPLSILDLGCGTGLSGAAFADLAGVLDGVDLSPAMAVRSRRRGCYRQISVGDLVDALDAEHAARDLILAVDVLNYLGDLGPCLAAARRAIRPGGLFLLALEEGQGAPITLGHGQRFRHSPAYLAETAAAHGFAVLALERCAMRREKGRPVVGLLAALRPDADQPTHQSARRTPQDPPRQAGG